MGTVVESLVELSALLDGVRDVLAGRVRSPTPPDWCTRRGWDPALLALDDATLIRCEQEGLARVAPELPQLPPDLRALAGAVRAALARIAPPEVVPPAAPIRRVKARKRGQLAALVALVRARLGSCRRVVDVGAGLGHLTRELASELGVPALGLEREPARVATARALSETVRPEFAVRDAVRERLELLPGDLAVALHACGELGDALVSAVAGSGADLLLVNCCLQKVEGDERAPLSAAGRTAGLQLPRELLGLANLLSRSRLVESNPAGVMEARRTRYALRLLLAERGLDLPPGAEMRGLQRRRAHRGLAHLAGLALARRELPPAEPDELARVEARATHEFARVRRLSLPRAMLGRLLELAVVLDRAAALEEAGHVATVQRVFARALSPRNLGIVARAPGETHGRPRQPASATDLDPAPRSHPPVQEDPGVRRSSLPTAASRRLAGPAAPGETPGRELRP